MHLKNGEGNFFLNCSGSVLYGKDSMTPQSTYLSFGVGYSNKENKFVSGRLKMKAVLYNLLFEN